jgi:hypothetical protein
MRGALPTIPPPNTIRAELEHMVIGDLLGPVGGPDEEVVERTVRDRYLVGVLAPRKKVESGEWGVESEPTDPLRSAFPIPGSSLSTPHSPLPTPIVRLGLVVGGENMLSTPHSPLPTPTEEGDFPPILNDELAEEGSDWPEDGPADLAVALPKSTEPSSFGLTFCVDESAKEFQAVASWGQYLRPQKEDRIDLATGRALRLWKRHPRGGAPLRIPLGLGPIRPIVADPQCPDVTIQGIVRRCDPCWIVTLFLVNGQTESKPKDHSWLFQPQLAVEATDGSPIFIKKTSRSLSEKLDSVFRAEEEAMAMLYRHQVQFAVGHGVSVHAETAHGHPGLRPDEFVSAD